MKATQVCSVEGCDRKHHARGMCKMHYRRMQMSGTTDPHVWRIESCSVEHCERDGQITRGMCQRHYDRLRMTGTTEPPVIPTPAERLVAGLVRMPNGCLEWTGFATPKGYGRMKVNGKHVLTHRLAWALANGPIPEGLRVCHKCDNPPCCDVENHLFLATQLENIADRQAKGRGRKGPVRQL